MAKKFSIVRLEERLAPSSWHTGPVVQDGGQHYDSDNPSGGKGHSEHGNGHGYGHRHDSPPPGGCVPKDGCCDGGEPVKVKGNNGFGNGGDDPAPGNSGTNGAPNADQKLADSVR